jgi:hypothetical protein
VKFKTTGFNQNGVTVIEFRRTVMIYKRGHVPHVERFKDSGVPRGSGGSGSSGSGSAGSGSESSD